MPAAASLRVGGLSPHSSCDWPGQLVATVFAQGCPWACAYCHNPHLLPARGSDEIAWEEVLTFLRTRRGLLDGVVFTGGEPTLQDALPAAIADVRELGFQVGLHTGGQFPTRLARVLPQVDWVGFDVKAPWDDYDRITRRRRQRRGGPREPVARSSRAESRSRPGPPCTPRCSQPTTSRCSATSCSPPAFVTGPCRAFGRRDASAICRSRR